jgi:hypothetical protein
LLPSANYIVVVSSGPGVELNLSLELFPQICVILAAGPLVDISAPIWHNRANCVARRDVPGDDFYQNNSDDGDE